MLAAVAQICPPVTRGFVLYTGGVLSPLHGLIRSALHCQCSSHSSRFPISTASLTSSLHWYALSKRCCAGFHVRIKPLLNFINILAYFVASVIRGASRKDGGDCQAIRGTRRPSFRGGACNSGRTTRPAQPTVFLKENVVRPVIADGAKDKCNVEKFASVMELSDKKIRTSLLGPPPTTPTARGGIKTYQHLVGAPNQCRQIAGWCGMNLPLIRLPSPEWLCPLKRRLF